MNLGLLFVSVLLSFVSARTTINHDQVQPFEQIKPATDSEKSAIKYKPQLHISDGCHPYPAVQSNGSISGGLKWSGKANGDCKEPGLGSQVYSRSAWFKGKWAIMYAWYFPKGPQFVLRFDTGHRHFWSYAILWTDDPNPDNSTILGVSMSGSRGYVKESSPKAKYIVKGTTVKLDSYASFWMGVQALQLTKKLGETQDLITWEQLTDEACDALTEFDFESDPSRAMVVMPLGDDNFTPILKDSYPF
ncbi:hypothetical protein PInf_004429 [Phytophthora infestans]|nr:hypothetical protein PInf_004429 [Phytophthora infestans]